MERESKDYIDLKEVFDRVISKWPLFVISLSITLSLAVLFLLITPKKYEVRSTLQLKNESLSDKGIGNEKFISGLELLEGDSELEDEIGIISSNQLINRVLDQLRFEVSLYSYDTRFSLIGKKMSEEIYKGPVEILLNDTSHQLIHLPVYIKFIDSTRVKITAEGSDIPVLDMLNQEIVDNLEDVKIDTEINLSEGYQDELLSFNVFIEPGYEVKKGESYYFVVHNRESLLKQYSRRLNILPIAKGSNIVSLTSRGRTSAKEIDFLDKLMEVYIDYDLQKKNQLGLKTVEFIDRQLIAVYDSLVNVESNLEVFRSSNRIIDIGLTSTDLTDESQDLENQRAELLVQREYFVYIMDQLKRSRNISEVAPSSVGVNNQFFNDLLKELSALNKEKIDKSYSSKPNSPVIRVLDEKIENVKNQLIDNTSNLIKSTDIALKDNRRRTLALQGRIDALPQSERNLINIEREFALNDNIYNYLLQKRAEATIALASNLPDKTVIDYARKVSRKPVSPNSKLILMIALVFGLAGPVGFIIVSDFLNTRIRKREEASRILRSGTALAVDHIKSKQLAKQMNGQEPEPVHQFRFLAMNLLNKIPEGEKGVIAFTTVQPGAGTTVCAYNIALTCAGFGKRTMYIDLNFHKKKKSFGPSISDMNGYLNLSDYFYYQEVNHYDKEVYSPTKNLVVVPSGDGYGSVDDLVVLNSDRMGDLIRQMKEKYDVLVIDTPSMIDHVDFCSVEKFADLHVMVVRHNFINRKNLKKARNISPESQFEVIYNDFSS